MHIVIPKTITKIVTQSNNPKINYRKVNGLNALTIVNIFRLNLKSKI